MIRASQVTFANRLLIILVVSSFVVFPRTTMLMSIARWMILFLLGIVICGSLELILRCREGARSQKSGS